MVDLMRAGRYFLRTRKYQRVPEDSQKANPPDPRALRICLRDRRGQLMTPTGLAQGVGGSG